VITKLLVIFVFLSVWQQSFYDIFVSFRLRYNGQKVGDKFSRNKCTSKPWQGRRSRLTTRNNFSQTKRTEGLGTGVPNGAKWQSPCWGRGAKPQKPNNTSDFSANSKSKLRTLQQNQ